MQKGTDRRLGPGLAARLRAFATDECGAVTVDWVVLTGATVGLAVMMFLYVDKGMYSLGEGVGNSLSSVELRELGDLSDL